MAEETWVWVRTSALDSIIHGKVQSTTKRAMPTAATASGGSAPTAAAASDDNGTPNWGWSRATVTSSSGGGDGDSLEQQGPISVVVRDEESPHNHAQVELPPTALKEGAMVMANVYTRNEDEEDEHDHNDDNDDEDEEDDGGPSAYPDDLITLTHLHEPAVVYCLRKRYKYDRIYTATGPILLALNPFKNCKAMYTENMMKKYWHHGERASGKLQSGSSSGGVEEEKKTDEPNGSGRDEDEVLPPHVYGIADHSFRSMMIKLEETGGKARRTKEGGVGCDQSILVSGESGAGKTVTTKFIMKYLATLSKRSAEHASGASKSTSTGRVDIEQQVLQSNPILESFGNARTIRNDNSSRFGKFIEIQFTKNGSLAGACIDVYLLEKVRLITQAEGERNYHIFYEMLQGGMDDESLELYHLAEYTIEDFRMTSQSGTFDRRDGVEDCETFGDLCRAMDTIGFSEQERNNLFRIASAALHLSNLAFDSISADECEMDRENPHLEPVLNLLGLDADTLNQSLCYFSIVAGKERHRRSLPKEKAEKGVEALIKATYGALFAHIVQRINASLTLGESDPAASGGGSAKRRGGGSVGGAGGSGGKAATIGVLDIFGFESFQQNSFEQLCINYCNEALQQQFNLFVLQNEQAEYEREGIQWSFISFPENQDVLDLIDKKGSGILNILDDQCRAPGTTDKTFANALYQKCTKHPRFEANFRQVGARRFAVFHYAGAVEYNIDGFVEKNRDELPKEATELLLSSTNDFVKQLAAIVSPEIVAPAAPAGGGGSRRGGGGNNTRVTVGGQFSKQLHELRSKIDLTSPHYVRCLKPNDQLVPDHFDPVIVADQLRYAGVVEAVRVSRVGYPQRYSHAHFVRRYRILALREMKKQLQGTGRRSSSNKSKERPVDGLVNIIAGKIQSQDQGVEKSSSSTPVDLVAVGIQVGRSKVFLRRQAYNRLEKMRNAYIRTAATCLQTKARGYIAQRHYRQCLGATVRVQSHIRKFVATRRVHQERQWVNATRLQSAMRRARAHWRYRAMGAVAAWCQARHRGNVGRARFAELDRHRRATVLQRQWRCHFQFQAYRRKQGALLRLQCAVRSARARAVLDELKAHARNLQATAQERDFLKRETQRLAKELEKAQAQAQQEAQRAQAASNAANEAGNSRLQQVQEELEHLRRELETARQSAGDEAIVVKELRSELEEAQAQLQQERETALEQAQTAAQALEKSKADHQEVLRYAEESSAAIANLSAELDSKKAQLDTLQQEATQKDQQLTALQEQMTTLQQEQTLRASESQEADSELQELRREFEAATARNQEQDTTVQALLAELTESKEALAAATESSSNNNNNADVDSSEEMKQLREENERLRAELEQERSGFGGASGSSPVLNEETVQELETLRARNEELQQDLTSAKNQNTGNGGGNAEEGTVPFSDLEEARAEIAALQAKLQTLETSPMMVEVSSDGAEAEIVKLREEVENLEKELEAERATSNRPRNNGGGSGGLHASQNSLHDSSTSLKRRYKELTELAGALVEKDQQISGLKSEVVKLNEQLEITTCRSTDDSFELEADGDSDERPEGTTTPPEDAAGAHGRRRPVVNSLLHQMKSVGVSSRTLSAADVARDEAEKLREINDTLKEALEQAHQERDEAKEELRQEQERSARELEAFSRSLQGVDELRTAAETMSREINKKKSHSRRGRAQSTNDLDDQSVVSEASRAVEHAKKTLDETIERTNRRKEELDSEARKGGDAGSAPPPPPAGGSPFWRLGFARQNSASRASPRHRGGGGGLGSWGKSSSVGNFNTSSQGGKFSSSRLPVTREDEEEPHGLEQPSPPGMMISTIAVPAPANGVDDPFDTVSAIGFDAGSDEGSSSEEPPTTQKKSGGRMKRRSSGNDSVRSAFL